MAGPNVLQLHDRDNVAVALEQLEPGQSLVASGSDLAILAAERVERGHKVLLCDVAEGDAIIKHGVVIGYAAEPIAAGAWVHTHNCRSGLDERSHTLDRHTGATTDMSY